MYFKFFTIAILLLFISCKNTSEQNSEEKIAPNTHKVVVEEVKQAKAYTYLKVTEKGNEYWIATSTLDVQEEDVLYYSRSMEMKDFESKDLNQKFETIYFVDKMSDKPLEQSATMMNSPGANTRSMMKEGIAVDPVQGGITIAELFAKKDEYGGKSVKIRGQVVKYNSQIMGRNWVHIQDGTSYQDKFDLTITTNDRVKPGDIVTFEGIITLNKDFGAGYAYEVLMEEGQQK